MPSPVLAITVLSLGLLLAAPLRAPAVPQSAAAQPSAAAEPSPAAQPSAAAASSSAAAGPTAQRGASLPFALAGVWDATLAIGGYDVPFRLQLSGSARHPTGWFINGSVRVVATAGRYEDRHLVLDFAQYAKRLDLTLDDAGRLEGTVGPMSPAMHSRISTLPVTAQRAVAQPPGAAPRLAGVWIVPVPTDERAWKLVVHQRGATLAAVILRVDGDTGQLDGVWKEGRAVLGHFDGARPSLIELSEAPDHGLQLLVRDLHGGADLTLEAYRASDAAARGLPQPADPRRHTAMRDPKAPFVFSFPDLDGHLVTNANPRFAHKALIVDISGSWCPNCHDEAPLLEELYQRYRGRGLEVVSLSFEDAEQLASLDRLRAFIRRYGLTYTVLVGGTPAQARERLPEVTALDYWPTTFFVGRDGRVRAVHTGFAAPATGAFHAALRREFENEIEAMIAE